jgi:hypothetical protein
MTAAQETATILQLIYTSAATSPFDEAELTELLEVARTNNAALDVTGLLLYHEGSFIQVLEGERAVVDQLYDKIARDPRHHGAQILFSGFQDHRDFTDWSMGFTRIEDPDMAPEGFTPFLADGHLGLTSQDGDMVRQLFLNFRDGFLHASW